MKIISFFLGIVLAFIQTPIGWNFSTSVSNVVIPSTFLLISGLIFWVHQKAIGTRKLSSSTSLMPFLVGYILIELIVRTVEGWNLWSVPRFLFNILAIISAYGLIVGWRQRYITVVAFLLLLSGYQGFLDRYVAQYSEFGNLSGYMAQPLSGTVRLQNEVNNPIEPSIYKDKIVLMDFWNSHCAVCFQKFPHLQKLWNQYQSDPRILIQSVNIPWERDTPGQALRMIADRGYTFPVVLGTTGETDVQFGVQFYPTVILLKEGVIRFRGRLEDAEPVLEELLAER